MDHYIATEEAHDAHASDPALPGGTWHLLNPIMTSYIIHMEPPDSCFFEASWTCNLCATHYRAPVTKSEVVVHVKTEYVSFLPPLRVLICLFLSARHDIHPPKQGKDFVYQVHGSRSRRTPAIFNPSLKYLCRYCERAPHRKLRNLKSHEQHLFDKYGNLPFCALRRLTMIWLQAWYRHP